MIVHGDLIADFGSILGLKKSRKQEPIKYLKPTRSSQIFFLKKISLRFDFDDFCERLL